MAVRLALAQILAHLSIIPMVMWAHPYQYGISILVYFLMGSIGMSITYHRLVSHGAFVPPTWFKIFGLFSATIGLTGTCITWPAVHRAHHNHSDKELDPHSPVVQSVWWVQFMSMFYRPPMRCLRPFVKDPYLRFFHSHYFRINAVYALVLAAIDPFAVIYAYLFPAMLLWNGGSLINNVGHLFGYRNFATADASKNNPFLALFMWGEGWHNNHHRYPRRANFGQRWFELDPSYWIIKLVQRKPSTNG